MYRLNWLSETKGSGGCGCFMYFLLEMNFRNDRGKQGQGELTLKVEHLLKTRIRFAKISRVL